jgi:hypothetical protein
MLTPDKELMRFLVVARKRLAQITRQYREGRVGLVLSDADVAAIEMLLDPFGSKTFEETIEMPDRDRLTHIGEELAKLRPEKCYSLVVDVREPDTESLKDFFKVTVRDLQYEGTGSGVYLPDAIHMAKASLKERHENAEEIEDQIGVVKVLAGEGASPQPAQKVSAKGIMIKKIPVDTPQIMKSPRLTVKK